MKNTVTVHDKILCKEELLKFYLLETTDMKLSDRFFKNRVKQIVITQFILIIPMLVFILLSFTTYPVNFFYSGFVGIILAISMFLNGIEQYILKKKRLAIPFFALTLLIMLVVVNMFQH